MDARTAAGRAEPLVQRYGPPGAVASAPLPVRHPDGGVESWLVPVAVGDALAGWVRVRGGDAAWSALGRRVPVAAWTDPAAVRRAAESAGHAVTGEPYLGYDGVPDRLAWVVPVAGGTAYVAGDAVWT